MKDTCRSTGDLRGLLLAIVGFALTAVTLGALAAGAQNPAGISIASATQTPAPTRAATATPTAVANADADQLVERSAAAPICVSRYRTRQHGRPH